MKKDTVGKIIFAVAVVATIFLAKVAGASAVAPTVPAITEGCKREVAFNALQLANALSTGQADAKIEVNAGEVEADGKSASAYVVPIATGGNALVLGKDVWTVPAHRNIKGKKDTFIIQTTTTTNVEGDCRVLALTLVDHIEGR